MYFHSEKEDESLNVRPEAQSEHRRTVFIRGPTDPRGFPGPQTTIY